MNYIFVGAVESLTVSTTLISTVVVSALFLKERIGVVKFVSVIICIIGIFCITQPEFVFKNVNLKSFGDLQDNEEEEYDNFNNRSKTELYDIQCALTIRSLSYEVQIEKRRICANLNKSMETPNLITGSHEYIGYTLVIVNGLSQAFKVFLIRGTSIIEVTYDIQLLWSHLIGFLVSLLLMFIFESPNLPDDIYNVLYLTGHVTLSFLATVTYFVALNYFASGILVTLNYSSGIVLSMSSQYFIVYKIHSGHRNLLEIGGAVLVLPATCMNPVYQLVSERLRKEKTNPKE